MRILISNDDGYLAPGLAALVLARVPVAVNLSNLQFHALGFVDTVERALTEAGASGPMLELELTERMLMDDLGTVQASMVRLDAVGYAIKRAGRSCFMMPEAPLAQITPLLIGWSGLPSMYRTCPSRRCTRMPQRQAHM